MIIDLTLQIAKYNVIGLSKRPNNSIILCWRSFLGDVKVFLIYQKPESNKSFSLLIGMIKDGSKHECILNNKKIYDDHVWATQSDYQN